MATGGEVKVGVGLEISEEDRLILAREAEERKTLIEKGFSPHTKGPSATGMVGAMGTIEEAWWDKAPTASMWPMVAWTVVVALFLLILVKGWPFA